MGTIDLEFVPGEYTTCPVLRVVTLRCGTQELLVENPKTRRLLYVYILPR